MSNYGAINNAWLERNEKGIAEKLDTLKARLSEVKRKLATGMNIYPGLSSTEQWHFALNIVECGNEIELIRVAQDCLSDEIGVHRQLIAAVAMALFNGDLMERTPGH